MKISLTVEDKRRNHDNDAHDSMSPNIDSLSTKLKHNVLKEYGQNFVSPANEGFLPRKLASSPRKALILFLILRTL